MNETCVFQDGGNSFSKGADMERGLAMHDRSKRCICISGDRPGFHTDLYGKAGLSVLLIYPLAYTVP